MWWRRDAANRKRQASSDVLGLFESRQESSKKLMSKSGTVGVRYRCRCMESEIEVQVPVRKVATDVVFWLDDVVMPRVFADHSKRSPECREKTLAEVKLPVPPDGPVGGSDV